MGISERIETQKKKIDEKLFDFIYLPHYEEELDHLARNIPEEEWGEKNYILDNYIKQTFSKLASDYNKAESSEKNKYILFNETFTNVCFNTGLFNKFLEPIYLVSKRDQEAKEDDKSFWFEAFKFLNFFN